MAKLTTPQEGLSGPREVAGRLMLHDPAAFGQRLLDQLVLQGFQTLAKRDIELLVVYLLEQDGALSKTITNFEVASILRLPLAKVKRLRREGYARWRPFPRWRAATCC